MINNISKYIMTLIQSSVEKCLCSTNPKTPYASIPLLWIFLLLIKIDEWGNYGMILCFQLWSRKKKMPGLISGPKEKQHNYATSDNRCYKVWPSTHSLSLYHLFSKKLWYCFYNVSYKLSITLNPYRNIPYLYLFSVLQIYCNSDTKIWQHTESKQ